jgi:hypothetical protein
MFARTDTDETPTSQQTANTVGSPTVFVFALFENERETRRVSGRVSPTGCAHSIRVTRSAHDDAC